MLPGLPPRRMRSTNEAARRIDVGDIGAVRDEPAAGGEQTIGIDRRQAMTRRQRDDLLAMIDRADVRQHQQAAVRRLREFRDHPLEAGRLARRHHRGRQLERRRGGRDRPDELVGKRRGIGIEHDRHPFKPRHNILERLDPFAADREFEIGDAGQIAAGLRQIGGEALTDRIGDLHEHDRHGAGLRLQHGRHRRAVGEDQFRLQVDELRRALAQRGAIAGPAVFDLEIAALDPAEIAQPALERGHPQPRFRIVLGKARQHGDPAHRSPAAQEPSRGRPPRAPSPPRSPMNARRCMMALAAGCYDDAGTDISGTLNALIGRWKPFSVRSSAGSAPIACSIAE